MRTQIAIIAGGLAIAAGVAYAELKPAKINTGTITQKSAPAPVKTPQTSQTQQSSSQTQAKSAPAPHSKITNPNTQNRTENHPPLPSGGGEHEGRENGFLGFSGGGDD